MVEAIRPETAFVYIFRRADGLFKVGFSANPKHRRAVCSTQTGVWHEIEYLWHADYMSALQAEHGFHYRMRKLKFKGRSSIELYDLPLDRLVEEIEVEWAKLGTKPGARAAGMSTPGFIKAVKRAKERQNAAT